MKADEPEDVLIFKLELGSLSWVFGIMDNSRFQEAFIDLFDFSLDAEFSFVLDLM